MEGEAAREDESADRPFPGVLAPTDRVGGVRRAVRVARRAQFGACGKGVRFDPWGVYAPAERMFFGSDIFIASGARIVATEGFHVGDHVLVGPEFCVLGGDHNFSVPGKLMCDVRVGGRNLPVRIERDVWVGARVTLLKGVRIGEGTVLGACSVVSKDIPPFVIALGHPCAPIRPRFSVAQLEAHLTNCDSLLSVADVVGGWTACDLHPSVQSSASEGTT